MRHAFAWVAMTEAFLAANQTLLPPCPLLCYPVTFMDSAIRMQLTMSASDVYVVFSLPSAASAMYRSAREKRRVLMLPRNDIIMTSLRGDLS